MAALADMIWDKKRNPNRASALMENDDGDSLAMGGDSAGEEEEPAGGGGNYLEGQSQPEEEGASEPAQDQTPESEESGQVGSEVRPLSESIEAQDQGQNNDDLPSSEGALSAQATGAPSTTVHRPRPALDAYQKQLASAPTMPKPKLWQQILAGAAGGLAGYSNAAGTRAARIDSRPAVRNILYGNYDRQMGNWNARTGQMEKAADLETKLERTDVMAETARARQKAYEAMEVRAEAMRKREENRPTPLSRDQIETNSRNDRAKYAQQQGWTEEKVPGMTQWVATGKFGVAKSAVEPKVPAKYFGMNPTDAAAAAARDNDLARGKTIAATQRLQRGPVDRSEITPAQRDRMLRQARNDKANAYRNLLAYKAAKMKEEDVDPATLQQEINGHKQQIEDQFAQSVSDATGQDVQPFQYDFRKGEAIGGGGRPPSTAPVQPPAQPPTAPPRAQQQAPQQRMAPPQQQHGAKTATPADIQRFAIKYNMTPDQAIQRALHEGYTVLGR